MELVEGLLKKRLPAELCGEIETLAHDFSPVMAELLQKHPQKFPVMVIRTSKFHYVRRLLLRYGSDVRAVSFDGCSKKRTSCTVEVGETTSLHKVRVYRYLRQPRWISTTQIWREVDALVE